MTDPGNSVKDGDEPLPVEEKRFVKPGPPKNKYRRFGEGVAHMTNIFASAGSVAVAPPVFRRDAEWVAGIPADGNAS